MCSHRFPYGKSRKLVEPPFFKLPQSSKYKFLRNEISCLQATTPHGSYCMLESSTFAGLSRISSIFITICHPLSVVRLWQPCPPPPPPPPPTNKIHRCAGNVGRETPGSRSRYCGTEGQSILVPCSSCTDQWRAWIEAY